MADEHRTHTDRDEVEKVASVEQRDTNGVQQDKDKAGLKDFITHHYEKQKVSRWLYKQW